MEAVPLNNQEGQLSVVPTTRPQKTHHFVEGNSVAGDLWEIRNRHVVPTYADSTPLISHSDFIECVQAVVIEHYSQETILSPEIRLSHPFLGRSPKPGVSPLVSPWSMKKPSFISAVPLSWKYPLFWAPLVDRSFVSPLEACGVMTNKT